MSCHVMCSCIIGIRGTCGRSACGTAALVIPTRLLPTRTVTRLGRIRGATILRAETAALGETAKMRALVFVRVKCAVGSAVAAAVWHCSVYLPQVGVSWWWGAE
jgi:hypothetical protein